LGSYINAFIFTKNNKSGMNIKIEITARKELEIILILLIYRELRAKLSVIYENISEGRIKTLIWLTTWLILRIRIVPVSFTLVRLPI
jgi:hypothetical protein